MRLASLARWKMSCGNLKVANGSRDWLRVFWPDWVVSDQTRFNLGHAPQSTIRAPAIGSYCARVVVASPSTISYISCPLNYPSADFLNVRNHPKMAPSRARATPAGENAIALMDKRTLAVAASVANVCLGMPKRPEMSRIDQMGANGSRDRTACFRPFLLNPFSSQWP